MPHTLRTEAHKALYPMNIVAAIFVVKLIDWPRASITPVGLDVGTIPLTEEEIVLNVDDTTADPIPHLYCIIAK